MNHQTRTNILAGIIAGVVALSAAAFAQADDAKEKDNEKDTIKQARQVDSLYGEKIDSAEAIALANKDSCWRCHSLTKKKEGPIYHDVAEKYRGKEEAVDKLIKHITLGKDVIKLSDGHKELHKFDQKRSPEEIRNLILFILAQ